MSDTEENQQIQENTSDSLGEKTGIENVDAKDGDDTKASKKKPGAINKNGQPRKTISDEAQKARLEVLRKGREKANIKRQLAKEALSKKEHNPPAIVEQAPVKTVKVIKPKKKTIVIEESSESEEEEEQVMVVKRIKKPKTKQVEPPPLAMHPPPPRPPPVRQESEADKKKKLIQLKADLENKKIYKSLFG